MSRLRKGYKAQVNIAAIRQDYDRYSNGHFFDRSTMRFFGDTMKSFGTLEYKGQLYFYRKHSAMCNVFGKWSSGHFNVWTYNFDTHVTGNVPEELQREIDFTCFSHS